MRHHLVVAALLVANASIVGAESMQDVVWIDAAGVSVSGATLTKAGSGGWNAGATSSLHRIRRFRGVHGDRDHVQPGLGPQPRSTGIGYTEIDYAVYLTNAGSVSIYESGTFRGSRSKPFPARLAGERHKSVGRL